MPELSDKRLARPAGVGTAFHVIAPAAGVRETPDPAGLLATQALHGELVDVYLRENGFGLSQLRRDRYVGWINLKHLSAPSLPATHKVSALRTFGFSQADVKSAPRTALSLGARVAATGLSKGNWTECAEAGWIHQRHLAGLAEVEADPASVAERFIGAPYLWGGRESLGLDCSGLTQQAFEACGVILPRDSDMQAEWAGEPLPKDEPLRRGDLVFWEGHVGILTAPDKLLHANAYFVETMQEPLADALARIGPATVIRRVSLTAGAKPDWLAQ